MNKVHNLCKAWAVSSALVLGAGALSESSLQTASADESVEQKPAKAKKEPKAGKP